jgi:hypothetical protein
MKVECKEYPFLLVMNPRIQFKDGVAECDESEAKALKELTGFEFSFRKAEEAKKARNTPPEVK